MKKILFAFLSLLLTISIIYTIYYFISKDNNINKNDNNITIKEDELTTIGYTKEEAKEIRKLFTKEEIDTYLLKTKYDDLLSYKKCKAFKIENLNRYITYKEKNNYSIENIVNYVEINLDKEFYTDIKEIDSSSINKLTLVNKYNKLIDNYEASDLITLDKNYSSNKQKVKSEIFPYLKNMFDDAKKEGLSLKVISGYRTHSLQNTLFNNSKKRNGLDHALMYSARPGHSEHQLGYAVDINTVQEKFKNTKEYAFLKDNAYKYGFIERYKEGKEFITGYGYEPWHYRYVGIDAAKIIYENDLTLEEYLLLY